MRITTTINDLTSGQWDRLNRVLLTSYDLAGARVRVCATFVYAGLERHVEMPLGVFTGTLMSLQISSIATTLDVALAALSPDELPDDAHAVPAVRG